MGPSEYAFLRSSGGGSGRVLSSAVSASRNSPGTLGNTSGTVETPFEVFRQFLECFWVPERLL
jgi:hypothetical protein